MTYAQKDSLAALEVGHIAKAALTLCRSMPTDAKKNANDKVYVIRCGDYVKIGYTQGAVKSRIAEFELGNPHEIELLCEIKAGKALEQTLHVLFNDYHHKREWFSLGGELSEFIAHVRDVVHCCESQTTTRGGGGQAS